MVHPCTSTGSPASPTSEATNISRNVTLLAEVDGVLVEERLDLVYRSGPHFGAILSGPRRDAHQLATLAKAFEVCTGARLEDIEFATTVVTEPPWRKR